MRGAADRGRALRCWMRRLPRDRGDRVSDRCFHQGRNAFHAAGVWQWRGGRAPDGVGAIRVGGEDGLSDPAGLLARALRCRARHRLSAAARRLCRGALPASDPRGDRGRAVARRRSSTEVRHGIVDQLQFRKARRRLSRRRRGASRLERRAERRSRRRAGARCSPTTSAISTCCAKRSRWRKRRMVDASQQQQQQQQINVSNEVRN